MLILWIMEGYCGDLIVLMIKKKSQPHVQRIPSGTCGHISMVADDRPISLPVPPVAPGASFGIAPRDCGKPHTTKSWLSNSARPEKNMMNTWFWWGWLAISLERPVHGVLNPDFEHLRAGHPWHLRQAWPSHPLSGRPLAPPTLLHEPKRCPYGRRSGSPNSGRYGSSRCDTT